MGILVRAVITGFGLSVGAALYKKVAKQLGLDEKGASEQTRAGAAAASTGDSGTLNPSHDPTRH